MNRRIAAAALALTAALTLTACAERDDDDCETTPVVMFFNVTTGHYHYDNPKGKVVPAKLVPASARKVPGYKAPSAKVAPPPRVDLRKPAPAPAKPAAPRGRR